MLAITQYEVYVMQKGRWTIHARYPGEERNQAVQDAQSTEASTGFPTKVIRETYFPEGNESERITTYVSPKAKELKHPLTAKNRRSPLNVARAATSALARRRAAPATPTARVKTRLTATQVFFRVLVAGGISLAAATLVTGVFAWALHRVAEAGVDIAPDTRTMLLTYAYVLMFLFLFYSLFRSRLPLHRLIADLWAKAGKATVAADAKPVDAKPPRVKPKHEHAPSVESQREVEDLKVKRGDLDPTQPQQIPETIAPVAAAAPEVAPAPPSPAEKAKKKREDAKLAAAEQAALAREAKASEPKEVPAPAEIEELAPETFNLERTVLRRFAADVVKSAVGGAMPNDPVARRGMAIVLSGAAAGIAATARLSPAVEVALLTDSMQHIGINQPAIDSFMGLRAQHLTAPANTALVAAGRSALAAYLEGSAHVAAGLTQVMMNWRTPMGHNVMPTPFVHFDEDGAGPLIDVYMLTELRETPRRDGNEAAADAFHDQAMGAHNGAVRPAVTAHGGHEVKHTGKGIFARFHSVQSAVEAAMTIQRSFADNESKVAIGLVGNTVAGEDPLLSATLVRQAQAIVARAAPGEILCEAQVQAAIRRHEGGYGMEDHSAQAAEDLDLVRLTVAEPDFETGKPQKDIQPATP